MHVYQRDHVHCMLQVFSQLQRLKHICCELEKQKKFTDRPTHFMSSLLGFLKEFLNAVII